MDFINQMEPSIDEEEQAAVGRYMQSGGWLMEYKKTREFERMIAEYTGAKYCSAMPNGTLSLSVALLACGVSAGYEVIVPDYTMAATPNAVELIGAKAVFADIGRETLCMDLEKMKEAVTPRTKAVLFVSINGRCPANIYEYKEYCKSRNIHFIEDAAQSLGSRFQGTHCGRFGEIGSFSFSVPKIITTGQGGALITDDQSLFEKIRLIRDFGREKSGCDHYIAKGWNFKFTDLQAVIGIEQMKKLPARVQRKQEIWRLYQTLLKDVSRIEMVPVPSEDSLPWFFEIICERREELQAYLKRKNIGSRICYPPLHAEPAYGYRGVFPVTEAVTSSVLWLPSSVTLKDGQIKYICGCIKAFYTETS